MISINLKRRALHSQTHIPPFWFELECDSSEIVTTEITLSIEDLRIVSIVVAISRLAYEEWSIG